MGNSFVYLLLHLNKNHKTLQVLAFPKCGLPILCFRYIQRYKEFCPDLNSLNKVKIVEILQIAGNIESITNADHIFELNCQEYIHFVIINLTILPLKIGLRISTANNFTDQRRPSNRLTINMFRETLCSRNEGREFREIIMNSKGIDPFVENCAKILITN